MIFVLWCDICGARVGEADFPLRFDVTRENCGFEDIRCSSCEAQHGSFKEMELFYTTVCEKGHDDFMSTLLSCERKASELAKHVVSNYPEAVATSVYDIPMPKVAQEVCKVFDSVGMGADDEYTRFRAIQEYQIKHPNETVTAEKLSSIIPVVKDSIAKEAEKAVDKDGISPPVGV